MRFRLLATNLLLLMALGGSIFGRQIESANVRKISFLSNLKLPFRDWKTKDFPLSAGEAKLLEPDDVIVRWYTSSDERMGAELAVIAGHRKRSVHTPGFCMAGGGWEVITQHNANIEMEGKSVPVSQSLMALKEKGQRMLVTYYFTDGEYSTSSLSRFQFHQLTRRFQAGIPLGALVRIRVPMGMDDPAAAEALTNEFALHLLPMVMKSLRETTLKTN